MRSYFVVLSVCVAIAIRMSVSFLCFSVCMDVGVTVLLLYGRINVVWCFRYVVRGVKL